MFLKELISQGWQALMRDRTRSALTMLGIGWGLVSVVLLLAYGQGLGGCVLHAFLNMGNNVIVLWPGQTSLQAGGQRAGKKVTYELEDVEAIRDEVPLVRAVSGEIDRDFGFKIGTRVVSIMTRGVDLPDQGVEGGAVRHRLRGVGARAAARPAPGGARPRIHRAGHRGGHRRHRVPRRDQGGQRGGDLLRAVRVVHGGTD